MLEISAIASVVLILGVVLGVVLLRKGPGPMKVFCPTRGTMAEIHADVCRAVDGSGVVGSPWDCQRECLLPREAEIRRRLGASKAG